MSATRVVTGKVRASYVFLDKMKVNKRSDGTQTETHSVTLLIPKPDKATLKGMKDAQEAAITAKWGDKRPKVLKSTVHDGDGTRPSDGEEFGPECKGHYVVTVTSKNKPGIVDQNVKPVLTPNFIVSGDYVRADLNCAAYEDSGSKGTSFYLNNIQLWEKGEPLGNVSRPEDAFTPIQGAGAAEGDDEDVTF